MPVGPHPGGSQCGDNGVPHSAATVRIAAGPVALAVLPTGPAGAPPRATSGTEGPRRVGRAVAPGSRPCRRVDGPVPLITALGEAAALHCVGCDMA
ncbi:hypothetical protein GCM10027563_23100 [Parasphingorhabdus pacifica]